eukprot:COSAG02_NODE_821_length_16794_cov_42.795747_8_plen_36_part_00
MSARHCGGLQLVVVRLYRAVAVLCVSELVARARGT